MLLNCLRWCAGHVLDVLGEFQIVIQQTKSQVVAGISCRHVQSTCAFVRTSGTVPIFPIAKQALYLGIVAAHGGQSEDAAMKHRLRAGKRASFNLRP